MDLFKGVSLDEDKVKEFVKSHKEGVVTAGGVVGATLVYTATTKLSIVGFAVAVVALGSVTMAGYAVGSLYTKKMVEEVTEDYERNIGV